MLCGLYCLVGALFFIHAAIRHDLIGFFSRIAHWPMFFRVFHALAIGLVNAGILSEIARGLSARFHSAKIYFTTYSIIAAVAFVVQMSFMSLLNNR